MQRDVQLVRLIRTHVEGAHPEVPSVEDILERLVAAPSKAGSKEIDRIYERPRRSSVRAVDYLAMEARNSSLGRAGERFVVNFERARLIRAGEDGLADRVEHVAVSVGDGLGFDVLSFEASAADRLIEVKITAYGIDTPFYVSANELGVSRERSTEYHLYRPFRFRTDLLERGRAKPSLPGPDGEAEPFRPRPRRPHGPAVASTLEGAARVRLARGEGGGV